MTYTLNYSYFKATNSDNFDTIDEAIFRAWLFLEYGEGWPTSITKNNEVLWEESGPFTTTKSMIEFAKKNNIKLDKS